MGIIMGALGGLGEGLADIGRRNQIAEQQRGQEQRAAARDIDMLKLREELEFQRSKNIADYNERKREAPAKRFGIIAQAKAGEEVPLEAAPVTEFTSEGARKEGLQDGIIGSQNDIKSKIMQYQSILNDPQQSSENKQTAKEILDQLSLQFKGQEQVNQDAVAGQTRKRSSDEVIDAAYNEALINDPTAAMAIHPVLREARADKKTDADIRDRNARADRLEKKQDLQLEYQMAKEERLMTYQENQQKYQQSLMDSNSEKEKQAAINGMRKATEISLDKVDSELRSLRKDLADAGIDPNKKAELESMKKELEVEAKRYRQAIANNGFELPEVKAGPAPFPVGTVKSGYEFLGGDVNNQDNWKLVSSTPPKQNKQTVEATSTRPQVDTSKRNEMIDQFNKTFSTPVGNSSKRQEAISNEYKQNLDAFKSGNIKEMKDAVRWYNEHAEDLTNEQKSTFRSAKKSSGIL